MTTTIWGTLDAMGITVEYTNLPPERDGEYIHDRRLIRLQRGMATRLHRSVLAHECAHAVFGDAPSRFGPVNAKQERRADEWAALRLIDIHDYRRAESIHHGHTEALAVELNVTVDLIEAYQRSLFRTDDAVYVQPRHGAGQWAHREQVA